MQSVPPIISSFARIVTPYAVTLLQAQWLQSLHYTVELQQNDVYLVKRISSAVYRRRCSSINLCSRAGGGCRLMA